MIINTFHFFYFSWINTFLNCLIRGPVFSASWKYMVFLLCLVAQFLSFHWIRALIVNVNNFTIITKLFLYRFIQHRCFTLIFSVKGCSRSWYIKSTQDKSKQSLHVLPSFHEVKTYLLNSGFHKCGLSLHYFDLNTWLNSALNTCGLRALSQLFWFQHVAVKINVDNFPTSQIRSFLLPHFNDSQWNRSFLG